MMATGMPPILQYDIIHYFRSNSTSLTIEDIYEKLENLTMRISDVEKFESRIENMNLAIARLEQQMIEVWNPTPEWIQIIFSLRNPC